MKKTNFIIVCIHKNLMKEKAGSEIKVLSDSNGIPLSGFWRKRLKDFKTDGFCSVKTEPEKSKKASKGGKK